MRGHAKPTPEPSSGMRYGEPPTLSLTMSGWATTARMHKWTDGKAQFESGAADRACRAGIRGRTTGGREQRAPATDDRPTLAASDRQRQRTGARPISSRLLAARQV